MRNIVFRFEDSRAFAQALRDGDQELLVPPNETVTDGEWTLAIFEVGQVGQVGQQVGQIGQVSDKCRATAAAARGLHRGLGGDAVLSFERRDWDRLVDFAEAGSMTTQATPVSQVSERPTQPSLTNPTQDPASSDPRAGAGSVPSFAHWRATDPFAQGPAARVLLVDDDEDIRDVVGAMLDAVGLTVDAVTSAEQALERARAETFDLVVLDWNLPGMTGIELCRLIRRDKQLCRLPVLFLTAHASSRDVVEAFASGADDYVVKPFRAPELGARIFGLLRRARLGSTGT